MQKSTTHNHTKVDEFKKMIEYLDRLTQQLNRTASPSVSPLYIPTSTPSSNVIPINAPVISPVTQGYANHDGGLSDLILLVPAIIFFMILVVKPYCCPCCEPPTGATTLTANADGTTQTAPTTPSQGQMNAVKHMTLEERKVYVSNFLKTQKYVESDNQDSEESNGQSSFCIAKSTSERMNTETTCDVDKDELLENGEVNQKPSCAICLETFHNGEDICVAQNADCHHKFHMNCIFPWLLKSQDCPCCRRDYLTKIESDRLITLEH